MIRTALLSVSDKNGIVPFAKSLHEQGIKLISTGGTAKLLAENNLPVVEVSSLTKFPEMLDGRVKTLHPMVHGGLLARRDFPEHMAALKEHGIDTIDMLVINLYPFNETVAKENCSFEDAVENIDIGGPAMLRAAAKNHQDVTVLISPEDYAPVLAEMKANNNVVSYKTNLNLGDDLDHKTRSAYPETLHLAFEKVQEMRYGENPHQSAAFYKDIYPVDGALANYKQLQGKELSYNNIADADSAWECVKSFTGNVGGAAACVIIKHANPLWCSGWGYSSRSLSKGI
jgi:phosphoribosylaminoimidazolecarboxamide formyltransferase/IMP cyclohydrolase